jgi:zinc/manganese transport system permease protein
VNPSFSWNLLTDFQEMWSFPFMVNAFRAATIVAVVGGVVGYFIVTRRQTFATHTLAMTGFPGAAGATLLGISTLYGYFGLCVVSALVLALLTARGRQRFAEESAATATVQAALLGLGYLFVNLYHGNIEGLSNLLFGTPLGVTSEQVLLLAVIGAVVLGVLAVIGRPLMYASHDPESALARGVPVRPIGAVFLVLVGTATAAASELTGALLVFAMLVVPAATATRLTGRPALAMALAVLIGLLVSWLGLVISFYKPYPLGFFMTSLAFGAYLLSLAAGALRGRVTGRAGRPASLAGAV